MSYTITYSETEEIVRIKLEGRLTPGIAEEIAMQAAILMEEKACSHLLNDLRQAEIPTSGLQLFEISSKVRSSRLPRSGRRAILVNEITPDLEFFQTTFKNRGHMMRIFTDPEVALGWLKGTTNPASS